MVEAQSNSKKEENEEGVSQSETDPWEEEELLDTVEPIMRPDLELKVKDT